MHIFHASESIEVFLNNQISDLLGKNMELLDTLNLKIGWIGKDLINLK